MQVCQKEILLQHMKDLNTYSVCAQGQDLKLQALRTLQDKSPLPYKHCDILQTGGKAQIPFQNQDLCLFCLVLGFWLVVLWWGLWGARRDWFGFLEGDIACWLFFSYGLVGLITLSLKGNKRVFFTCCKTCHLKKLYNWRTACSEHLVKTRNPQLAVEP